MNYKKLCFQAGSISDYDWKGMLPCLKDVRTVLEFGGGFSTLLFREQGINVTTMETNLEWRDAILKEAPTADVRLWDNKNLPEEIFNTRYDLVFVDGQDPRDRQVYYALRLSDKIILHDGGRHDVSRIIKEQLQDFYEIPIKGRSHYYERKQKIGTLSSHLTNINGGVKREYLPVKKRYAAVTSCTDNYKQYLNGLLNSMDAQGLDIDFHVVVIDVNEDYLKQIENIDWSFKLFLHKITEEAVHKEVGSCKRYDSQHIRYRVDTTLYSKKSRYTTIRQIYKDYDVVMMLDADMIFVGDVTPFFDMVSGTDIVLGVNERFKWPLTNFDPLDGEEWPKGVIMNWMICNAPTWFSPAHHESLIYEVDYCAKNLRQKESVVSDLFSMNVALWRANVTDRVIQLPFHCWTGCHNGYIQMYTHLQKIKDKWISINGDPVYIIHGRCDKKGWEKGFVSEQHKRWNEIDLSDRMRKVDEARFTKIFRLIEKEFNYYNSECKVRL